MNKNKSLRGILGILLLAGAPLAHAIPMYSADFQGITFTFAKTDSDTLTFNIKGTPGGDWAGVKYLGAFGLKGLGLDFSTVTAIANGPGAVNLAGLNSEISASNLDCSKTTGEKGVICFDIKPDVSILPLPMDFTYTIDFSSALSISDAGVHLKIAWMNEVGGKKVGSLYSEDVPGMKVPEPSAGSLGLLGLIIMSAGMWYGRRRSPRATASV